MKSKDVEKVAGNYVDFFDASKGNTEKERKEHYETVVNSYYDLATDFYEYGWGQSFHFATQAKGEAYTQAIARHEHWLALQLQLKKDDLVLVRFYGSLKISRQGLWLRCWWTGA
jgi:sterol 24-C-methyltransferase